MAAIDGFAIIYNEEELIRGMLDSFASLGPLLGTLSLIDNGSTDRTLQIVQEYAGRLNIRLKVVTGTPHHGELRTLAIQGLTAPWILYLDSDETLTRNFADWFISGEPDKQAIWDIYKYSTILDRYHYVDGGNGPSTRLFRNLPGTHFPQNIHTHPEHPGFIHKDMIPDVWMFDHTGCKSREALWAKGWRYQWATGTIGIGPADEYIRRLDDALTKQPTPIREFGEPIRSLIFTGPQ